MPAAAAATPPTHQRALVADDDRPSRAGSAVHSAVRISGAARVSVFCHENQLPKAPWYISANASSGSTAGIDAEQQAEQRPPTPAGPARDGDALEGLPMRDRSTPAAGCGATQRSGHGTIAVRSSTRRSRSMGRRAERSTTSRRRTPSTR